MKPTDKQIIANRGNAGKSTGPVTPSGKAIASRNALRHGLLAKEIVINAGEGAESQDEFDALLADLKDQFDPQGTLEEMLVEKIASAYWRLRRAHRFEVGLIRNSLDNITDDFYNEETYGDDKKRTDEEIDQDIEQQQEYLEQWKKDKKELTAMHKAGKPLEEIDDWQDNWDWLTEKVNDILPEMDEDTTPEPKEMRQLLNTQANWSDDRIWQAHIELCDDRVKHHRENILAFEEEKEKNRLKRQVIMKLGSIPSKNELDRLLKYEGAIERQFYKAIDQLERLQRLRKGDAVPAPVNINLAVDTENRD